MNRQFIRIAGRYINVASIASFEILPTGFGDLRLTTSQAICVDPKEARVLAEYLAALTAEMPGGSEFRRGTYPVWRNLNKSA
jgi:hypothetical protein